MMLSIEEEIEFINDIIDSAISHGGDSGGAYNSDWDSLEESIGEWLHAKGIETFFTACENAIRPIKEIDILDYCEDTKIWYCIVSEYRLDEITAKGLTVPEYSKGVKLEVYRNKYGAKDRIRSSFGHSCFIELDIWAAVAAGKSRFYLCEETRCRQHFFVDYIPVNCFTIIKND